MKQKINFPLAITLVVLCGVLLIVVVLQYGLIPGIKIPLFNSSKDLEESFEDETSDWKTYINEEYGFEFEYPSEANLDDSISNNYLYVSSIPVVLNSNQLQFRALIVSVHDSDYSECDSSTYMITPEYYTVDGIEFTELKLGEGGNESKGYYYQYFTIKNEKCFIFSFALSGYKDDDIPKEEPFIFKQIISTFRFIDTEKDGLVSSIQVGSGKSWHPDELKEIQDNADSGSETWRLDPLLVAQTEGINYGFEEKDKFTLISQELSEYAGTYIARVEVIHNNEKYIIQLIQPIKIGDGGIWVINSIAKIE